MAGWGWKSLAVGLLGGLVLGAGGMAGFSHVTSSTQCRPDKLSDVSREGADPVQMRKFADRCWREAARDGNPWKLNQSFTLWSRSARAGDAAAAKVVAEIYDPEVRARTVKQASRLEAQLPPPDERLAFEFYKLAQSDVSVQSRFAALKQKIEPNLPDVTAPSLPVGVGTPPVGRQILNLVGSNTIGDKLAPALAQAYLGSQGAQDTRRYELAHDVFLISGRLGGEDVQIRVVAKGSEDAFKSLDDGTADIGMSSRQMKPDDLAAAPTIGDLRNPQFEHQIASDGLAIIVHQSNPIKSLSIAQVRAIFSGQTATWKNFNQRDRQIRVFARNAKSGTFSFFSKKVMDDGKTDIANDPTRVKRLEKSEELEESVARDPDSIGFVGSAYVKTAKAIPISKDGKSPVAFTLETLRSGEYPLSRPLFLYTTSKVQAEKRGTVDAFIKFALSAPGQRIVEQEHFVPLK